VVVGAIRSLAGSSEPSSGAPLAAAGEHPPPAFSDLDSEDAPTSVAGQEFHRRGKLLPIRDRRNQADDRPHDQERDPLLVRHAAPRGPRSSTT
jgi:hypothetical protein